MEKDSNDQLKKVTLAAFAGVVKRSPVDTGRFRGNWNGAKETPDLSTVDAGQNTQQGGAITQRESANLTPALQAKIGEDVYITNNLDYAQRLENGWSAQAPGGVLHITAREIQSKLDSRKP
jgi:hypothetical protein